MTLEMLNELLESGQFHHATYRYHGQKLWEGLYIYARDPKGFRGYSPEGVFHKHNADGAPNTDIDAAYEAVRHTGVSVGWFGNG